jgi:MFS family permease
MRLLADITPLRSSPAFRRLWIGSTLSSTGTALTNFAVTLQVYDLTRSTAAVGAVGVAVLAPMLVIGLLGGSVADTVDRRRLVLVTTVCQAAVSALLAAQAFGGLGWLWLLYLLVALESGVAAIGAPARRTFIPALLPADQLPAGMAVNRLSFQVMITAGPALAGVITAAPHLGLRACYLLDAVSYGAALYGVGRLPASRRAGRTERAGVRSVTAGLAFIRRSQVLYGALLADLNGVFFGLPLSLFPAINALRFGGSPRTLGLFTAAIGVGGAGQRGAVRPGAARLAAGRGDAGGGRGVGRGVRRLRGVDEPVAGAAGAGRGGGRGHVHRGVPRDHRAAGHAGGVPRPGDGGGLHRGRGRRAARQPGGGRGGVAAV